jgi:PAS domain S-box-containing protein
MSATPNSSERQPRVLIVDDERHNRQLLEVMLTPEGFHLLTAASGEEALAMVAREPPDLILLDIMMPGMDGFQVAESIKGNMATKDIPVIMVTALNDRNARMLGLKAGAEEFLTKPVDRAELTVRVRNLTRLKASGDDKFSQRLEGEVGSRTAGLLIRTRTLEQQAAVLTEQAALLDLAQDAIVVRDMDRRILFWSRGAEQMYGWPAEEALGSIMYDLLKTEFIEPADNTEAALLRHGRWEGELIHHRRDGTRLTVASRWALQRDAQGVPVRILTINSDITARKEADAERLLLTDRLSLATAVAKVGVWEWDLASNMITCDSTMYDIYGMSPVLPLLPGKWSAPAPVGTFAAAVHPADAAAVEATWRSAIAEKSQGAIDFRIVLADGSVRDISAVERVVLDKRGNVSRLIGVNMDVTERKASEKALEQNRQDQLRFKDEFLSHVSHELRSPLTAIKQFTSILLGGLAGELNPEQRAYQYIVLKNIGQLQSMIDDLLEVTRLETGKLTVELGSVSISSGVTDSFNTLRGAAEAKGVTLSSDLPLHLPRAHADQTRLRQVLIILLDNAIKFTPEGGAVTVRARLLEQDPRFLLVEVSDTGCGISPEISQRIFERLYQVSEHVQTSRKGLGLGLYICKELVTRQGGQIWVTRGAEKGTTFSFTLPIVSLEFWLAPLLRNDQWPAESVALVVVETCLVGPWPSREAREDWPLEARSLLKRCFLPDLDVLLPTMSSGEQWDRFYVAAFADDASASVLATRIRGQFERLIQQKGNGLTVSVTHDMLPPFSQDAGVSTDTIVTHMATHLEDAITSHTIRGTAAHE